jgi:tRNA threonylcarbamoyladenosine biosynthesis protein TsaE
MAEANGPVVFDCTEERTTERLGASIAAAVEGADQGPLLVTFTGELGAGKTTLVRAILRGLGHTGPVPSPTYMLLEPYELAGWNIAHLDFYRLKSADELENLGLRDWLAGRRLVLVEWPENASGGLPSPDVTVLMRLADGARSVELSAPTARGQALVATARARMRAAG